MTDEEKFIEACRDDDFSIFESYIVRADFNLTCNNNAGLMAAIEAMSIRIVTKLMQNTAVRAMEKNQDFPALSTALQSDLDPKLLIAKAMIDFFAKEELPQHLMQKLFQKDFLGICSYNNPELIRNFITEHPRFDCAFDNNIALVTVAKNNLALSAKELLNIPAVRALEVSNQCAALNATITNGYGECAYMMAQMLRKTDPQNQALMDILRTLAPKIHAVFNRRANINIMDREKIDEDLVGTSHGRLSDLGRASITFSKRAGNIVFSSLESFNTVEFDQQERNAMLEDTKPKNKSWLRKFSCFGC